MFDHRRVFRDRRGEANPGLVVLVVVLILAIVFVWFFWLGGSAEEEADVEMEVGALDAVPAAVERR